MIEAATRELISIASDSAEKVFHRRGQVGPMYHVVHPDGAHEVFPAPPFDKDFAVALVKAYIKKHDIRRVIFIDECWRLDMTKVPKEQADAALAFCALHGVAKHPGRIEAVGIFAEDALGNLNAYRSILRKGGHATLGPLVFDPEGGRYEGRMIGLLPQRGMTQ
jgi:hypothetical protein